MYLTDPGFNPPVITDEQGGYERLPDPGLIPPGKCFCISLIEGYYVCLIDRSPKIKI